MFLCSIAYYLVKITSNQLNELVINTIIAVFFMKKKALYNNSSILNWVPGGKPTRNLKFIIKLLQTFSVNFSYVDYNRVR